MAEGWQPSGDCYKYRVWSPRNGQLVAMCDLTGQECVSEAMDGCPVAEAKSGSTNRATIGSALILMGEIMLRSQKKPS